MRSIAVLLASAFLVLAAPALAANATITVIAPATAGACPVLSYKLYIDDVDKGALVLGVNAKPNLFPANAIYKVEVAAVGTCGEQRSDPQTVAVGPPGKPTFIIVVS